MHTVKNDKYVEDDPITTNVVINSDNEKLIELTFVLYYFIYVSYNHSNRVTKPKRTAS